MRLEISVPDLDSWVFWIRIWNLDPYTFYNLNFFQTVLRNTGIAWIRFRIQGLLDPDPDSFEYGTGTDPKPCLKWSIIDYFIT